MLQSLDACTVWKDLFHQTKAKIAASKAAPWTFDDAHVFAHTNAFMQRCRCAASHAESIPEPVATVDCHNLACMCVQLLLQPASRISMVCSLASLRWELQVTASMQHTICAAFWPCACPAPHQAFQTYVTMRQ